MVKQYLKLEPCAAYYYILPWVPVHKLEQEVIFSPKLKVYSLKISILLLVYLCISLYSQSRLNPTSCTENVSLSNQPSNPSLSSRTLYSALRPCLNLLERSKSRDSWNKAGQSFAGLSWFLAYSIMSRFCDITASISVGIDSPCISYEQPCRRTRISAHRSKVSACTHRIFLLFHISSEWHRMCGLQFRVALCRNRCSQIQNVLFPFMFESRLIRILRPLETFCSFSCYTSA